MRVCALTRCQRRAGEPQVEKGRGARGERRGARAGRRGSGQGGAGRKSGEGAPRSPQGSAPRRAQTMGSLCPAAPSPCSAARARPLSPKLLSI